MVIKEQLCLTYNSVLHFIGTLVAHRDVICQIKIISQIYFWNRTLYVSNSSSVHHQESSTVHTATVDVIPVMLTAC